jgi:hypothetical protein
MVNMITFMTCIFYYSKNKTMPLKQRKKIHTRCHTPGVPAPWRLSSLCTDFQDVKKAQLETVGCFYVKKPLWGSEA